MKKQKIDLKKSWVYIKMSVVRLPQTFGGRDDRTYIAEPKQVLYEILKCKTKTLEQGIDEKGNKWCDYNSDVSKHNTTHFYLHYNTDSVFKKDGTPTYIDIENRWYVIDIDIANFPIKCLPRFMKERGFFSISTRGKIHWFFQCDDDLTSMIGNKNIQLFLDSGEAVNDIDLKCDIREVFEGSIYYNNSDKNCRVSKPHIQSICIGTETQQEKEFVQETIYEDEKADTITMWRNLMWLCIGENVRYDTWSKMCFIMPEGKDYEDLFCEWSAVNYQGFCETECRNKFENSQHLRSPRGMYAMIKWAKAHDAVATKDTTEDAVIVAKRKFVNITHYSCARMFYNLFRYRYAYTTTSGWYKIDKNGNIECIDDGLCLRVDVVEALKPHYFKLFEEQVKLKDEEAQQKARKKFQKDLLLLENAGYVNSIISVMASLFQKKETFNPNPNAIISDKTFNIFNGFDASKMKCRVDNVDEIVKPFIEHINYICNGDGKYLLNWLAHIIQKPHKKTQVVVGITGAQGIGKDTVYEMGKRILGSQYCFKTSKLETDIFGAFNYMLKGKFLGCLAEVKALDTGKYMNLFKDIIDNPSITIQKKRFDTLEIPSFINFFITSNDINFIKLEIGDRRFNVINSKAVRNEKEYYDNLYKLLDDDTVIYTLYQYFMSRDISSFDLKADRVQSEYLQDLKEYSVPTNIGFLEDIVNETEEHKILTKDNWISGDDLFQVYSNYLVKMNIKENNTMKRSFNLHLRNIATEYGLTEHRMTKGRVWLINKDVLRTSLEKVGMRL